MSIYVSILIIIIGFSILLYQLYLLNKVIKSRDWETTEGEIKSSDLETLSFSNDTNKSYKAGISYVYKVMGKQYVGTRVFFGDKIQSSFKGIALKIITEYPVGSKVNVYYNPRNIEEAVLEKRVHSNIVVLLIVGLAAILIGFFLIRFYPQLTVDFNL